VISTPPTTDKRSIPGIKSSCTCTRVDWRGYTHR
jgi:hypothetical protein